MPPQGVTHREIPAFWPRKGLPERSSGAAPELLSFGLMTVSNSSNDYREPLARGVPMPPPEIPKQRIPRFTLFMMAFAGLVLLGIVASFFRVADEPRPVLDVPETEAVPAAPAAPAAPR